MKKFLRTFAASSRNLATKLDQDLGAIFLSALFTNLGRCWFLFLTGGICAVLFTKISQGQEALRAAAEDPKTLFALCSILGILVTIQVTAFAAVLLIPERVASQNLKTPEGQIRLFVSYSVPGLVGLTPVLLLKILIEFQIAGDRGMDAISRDNLHRFSSLMIFMTAFVILVLRNQHLKTGLADLAGLNRVQKGALAGFLLAYVGIVAIYFLVENAWWAAGWTLMLFLLGDVLGWQAGIGTEERKSVESMGTFVASISVLIGAFLVLAPHGIPPLIGPVATVYLLLNFWVAIGYLFLVFSRRALGTVSRYVGLALVGLLAFLFLDGPFSEHQIRLGGTDFRTSATVEDHAGNWLEHRRPQIESSTEKFPVFFVAAEGGGIRAAYWTASCLTALEDQGQLAPHLFAVSGASGGSLGGAVYTALVKARLSGPLPRCQGGTHDQGPFECLAGEVLGHDFLSPALVSLLVSDVLRSVLRREILADRATTLEEAFERAWAEGLRSDLARGNTFSEAFSRTWETDEKAAMPSLFLNGTHADSGERLVLSNLAFSSGGTSAEELRRFLGRHSFSLSTGVMMSARFPVISPVGRFNETYGDVHLAIVDGGFADNSGAATLAEVIKIFLAKAEKVGLREKILPVAVVIPNEPKVTGKVWRDDGYSLISPLEVLDLIRQNNSRRLVAELARQVEAEKGLFLGNFGPSRSSPDDPDLPLGWMLAESTRKQLSAQIHDNLRNPKSDFGRAVALLKKPRS